MSKHTPTPWYAERPFQEPGLYITSKVNTALIAKMNKHYDGESDESEADAAFIVRACNAHEGLVEALQHALDVLGGYQLEHDGETLDPVVTEALIKGEAALAQAQDPREEDR